MPFVDIAEEETTWQMLTSCRWTLAYICCLCFTVVYALRINMGIAMVCMVKTSNTSTAIQQKSIPEQCLETYMNSSQQQVCGHRYSRIELIATCISTVHQINYKIIAKPNDGQNCRAKMSS